eukprot:jgi/Picre1/35137/NNA_002599.t1
MESYSASRRNLSLCSAPVAIPSYTASVVSWRAAPSSASGMIESLTMSTVSCRTRWCSFRSPISLLIH